MKRHSLFHLALLGLLLGCAGDEDLRFKYQLNATDTAEYPGAAWVPCVDLAAFWARTEPIKRVILHQDIGTYSSEVNCLKNGEACVSKHIGGHFVVDRATGAVTQLIQEKYAVRHAGDRNEDSIAIYLPMRPTGADAVATTFTAEQYTGLAKLIKYLCVKYNLPQEREPMQNYNMNADFDWDRLVREVKAATAPAGTTPPR